MSLRPIHRLLLAPLACWAAMALPCPAADILMVTANSSLTSEESARKTQFEAWGHTVTTIQDGDSQANFDSAMASVDLVYVPEDSSASSLAYKLRTATVGVVSEEPYLDLEFGFSTTDGTEDSGVAILVTDNTHEISSGLSSGFLSIFSSSQPRSLLAGTAASGLQELATASGGALVLGYIETGGSLANTYSGNSTASGRRVRLPWGGGSFAFSSLDSDGQSILQNAIDWASAGGAGGGDDDPTPIVYLSTLGSETLAGLGFNDEDIVSYDADTTTASLYLDGTLVTGGADIDAAHLTSEGTLLLSLDSNGTIGGVSVSDEDIVEYDPSTGVGALIFEGDLVFDYDEEVDAVCRLPNGNLLISTQHTASIGFSLYFDEADLVEYNPDTGAASIYLSGSAVFNSSFENIDACHVTEDGKILLSTAGDAEIGPLSFGDDDIVEYDPSSGTARIVFDGGNLFSSSSEDIDAVSGDPGTGDLAGHWKLDETNGTTAADSSGNGRDGTHENGVLVGEAGVRSYAASFDGSDDGVLIGDFEEHDMTSQISVAAWVKLNSHTGSVQYVVAKGTSQAYRFRINAGGYASLDLFGTSGQETSGATVIPVGRWVHLVGTYDGSTTKIYVNGVLDGQEASTGAINVTNNSLTIGKSYLDSLHLDGLIDDVRLYNKALTGPEIAELYGLVGHWNLDESSGTTATDSSLTGADGVYGAGVTYAVDAPRNTGVRFNTTDELDVSLIEGLATAGANDGDLTIALWVKPEGTTGSLRYLIDGAVGELTLQASDNTVEFEVPTNTGGQDTFTTEEITSDTWSHIVAIKEGAQTRIYINGQLNTTGSLTGTGVNEGTDIEIGDNASGGINGVMDDVRIYNRAITEQEIAEIYGLVGHWKLDETSGSVAVDSSLMGNDGVWSGTAEWDESGRVDGAAEFDGASQITVSTIPTSSSSVSLAGWANLTAADSNGADLVSLGDHALIRLDNGSGNTTGSSYHGGGWQAASHSTLYEGAGWRHFAYVLDGDAGTHKLYVDGVEVASDTLTGGIDWSGLGSELIIGAHGNGDTNQDFTGLIDDVRVYNRPISLEEVQALFDSGEVSGLRIMKWVEVQ